MTVRQAKAPAPRRIVFVGCAPASEGTARMAHECPCGKVILIFNVPHGTYVRPEVLNCSMHDLLRRSRPV